MGEPERCVHPGGDFLYRQADAYQHESADQQHEGNARVGGWPKHDHHQQSGSRTNQRNRLSSGHRKDPPCEHNTRAAVKTSFTGRSDVTKAVRDQPAADREKSGAAVRRRAAPRCRRRFRPVMGGRLFEEPRAVLDSAAFRIVGAA